MPERNEYLEKVQKLHAAYSGSAATTHAVANAVDQIEANCIEFASANLRHLLPDVPIAKHDELINEILFNRGRSALDEDSCFLFENIDIRDPGGILDAASHTPVIFCTFHFGSYRLINQVIVSRSLNYILPVNSEIYATQKQRYEHNIKVLQAYFNTRIQLMIVNAEEPTAALSLARKTRAGWSLLAYIDGNTGVQGAGRRDSKTISVPLLGKLIFARKGIAFLSHFLNLPIVPVVCEITGNMQYTMTFHDKIQPEGKAVDRDAYCRMATEEIYAVLGEYLKKSPAQWEGWLDMQKYLDMDSVSGDRSADESESGADLLPADLTGRRLVFNHERFGFIIQEEGSVLLDKDTYKLLSLPENITRILQTHREPALASTDASPEDMDTVSQLVSMGMLSVVD